MTTEPLGPNKAIDKQVTYDDPKWGRCTSTSYRSVSSNVRVEDLLFFRDKVVNEMCDPKKNPMANQYEAIGWEMPDGRIIQVYPDVKIIDKVSEYNPVNVWAIKLQTVVKPDGTKDYTPAEAQLGWGYKYKRANAPFNPPWYVWPLRPIIMWAVLITLLVMWPWWTIGIFCGLSYVLMGWQLATKQMFPARQDWLGYTIAFLMAPIAVLWLLIMASLMMLPIL